MSSCTTPWEYEQKPGGSELYDSDNTYDQATFDTYVRYYDTLGVPTTWFYESPIDGCVAETYEFMSGDTFEFMDSSTFEF